MPTICRRLLQGLHRPAAIALISGAIAAGAALPLARAQQDAAFNPHPGAGDVILPLPGGWKIVFTKVPVPGKGFYGGADRIMEIGGEKQSPNPHEHPRQVRIGANFFEKSGAGYVLIGKYEMTIGQFAAILGDGDIAKGLTALAEMSAIEGLKKDGASPATMASDMRFLSRPIHGLGLDEYWAVISKLNAWCLTTKEGADCLAAMRKDLGTAGFFRLPTEPEWEYVARGGIKGMRAAAALPFPADEIAAFANVGTKKALPDEIGKKKAHPHLDIYDIFGNVAELMATPFSLDNGAGAIGSFVVRGGDFRTSASDVRVSYREEEPQFVFRSSAGAFVKRKRPEVGIRLMLGAPVKDPEDRTVTARIADEFRGSYVPCCGGGGSGAVADAYGNNLRAARDIGVLPLKKNVELSDSVGGPEDPADWFRFAVSQFGTLRMGLQAQDADVIMEVKHESWESPRIFSVKAGRIDAQLLQGLLPGNVRVKVFAANPSQVARWRVIMNFDAYDCCGNRAEEALDLGLLAGRQIEYSDYVGPGDLVDFVKFRTDRVDTISVRLLELTGDANVELYDSEKRLIDKSLNPGTAPERIEYANAPAGTYYIRVFAKDDKTAAMYKVVIALGSVDTAGDTPKTARDLGTIASDVVPIDEQVGGDDRGDVFKFRTTATAVIEVQISKLSADVTLELLDASERVIVRGSRDDRDRNTFDLNTARPAGEYYVVVRAVGSQKTSYTMTVQVRPAEPYTHHEIPYKMQVGAGTSEFKTLVTNVLQSRYVEFTVPSTAIYKITLTYGQFEPGTDVDLVLFRISGSDFRKVTDSTADPGVTEQIVQSLEPGRYLIRILWDRASKGKSAEVTLAVSQTTEMVDPPPVGSIVARHGDWVVTSLMRDNKRYCYAYTVATSVSPSGWRGVKPRLALRIIESNTGLFHTFDIASFYNKSRGWEASIRGRTGTFKIPVSVFKDENDIQSIVPCTNDRSSMCVSNDGMRGLTRGQELTLSGTTSDGRSVSIVYSLNGYQSAIREMNRTCNNDRNTGWLIQP